MNKAAQFIDIILLKKFIEQNTLSDKEASSLYDAWCKIPPGSIEIPEGGIPQKELKSLHIKGYISDEQGKTILTERGRKVIVEFVTNQPNAFARKKDNPTYNEIKHKASKRSRLAFKNKVAFNLRREKTSKE
jgi:hypothetical protein